MSIGPDETDLIGRWIEKGGRVVGDEVERRIARLVGSQLTQVALDPVSGAWKTLYRDPTDNRYWELTYPQSDMHGGGPRRLTAISAFDANMRYGLG